MNIINKESAVEALGSYAFNQRTGKIIGSRINRLMDFSNNHKNIEIRVNNNWSNAPGEYKESTLLGGTTYQYQVWAVAV